MNILFFRHGETPWNQEKRFQGHTDIALSKKGISEVSNWHMPENIQHWFVSPLLRAQQTAEIHKLNPITISEEIIEASWGQWEGKILKQLRKIHPGEIAEMESLGLDMRPPGGESPRDVRSRLSGWLESLPTDYERIGVVTHRGVIRAALSKATHWDMKSAHAVDVTHNKAYEFSWVDSQLLYIAQHDLIKR
ncbi:MAG: histidine phosphatase family protein [Desulfobulbia bacterium]